MLAAWSVGTEWDWDSLPEPPCPDRSLHAMFRSAPGVSRSPPHTLPPGPPLPYLVVLEEVQSSRARNK